MLKVIQKNTMFDKEFKIMTKKQNDHIKLIEQNIE